MKRRNPAVAARHEAARALQDKRMRELSEIRIRRGLTDAERAEENRLTDALVLRLHRQAQAEKAARIDAKIAAQQAREQKKDAA